MKRWFVDRSAQQGIPSVSLRRLLPDAEFVGCRDLVVSGCSADSRRIDPGQVFVAIRGPRMTAIRLSVVPSNEAPPPWSSSGLAQKPAFLKWSSVMPRRLMRGFARPSPGIRRSVST